MSKQCVLYVVILSTMDNTIKEPLMGKENIEEDIPLLNPDTPLSPEDTPKYFEAFKQFDRKGTGHISLRVGPICFE